MGDGGWADTSSGEALGAGKEVVTQGDIIYWLPNLVGNGNVSLTPAMEGRGLTPDIIARAWQRAKELSPKATSLAQRLDLFGAAIHEPDRG
jgi:hypothetical protein